MLNGIFGIEYAVTCFELDRRSDTRWFTRPNARLVRDSTAEIPPVELTMLEGFTNTGRFASSGSVNCGLPAKLRSIVPGCCRFIEYAASTARYILRRLVWVQPRLARQLSVGR